MITRIETNYFHILTRPKQEIMILKIIIYNISQIQLAKNDYSITGLQISRSYNFVTTLAGNISTIFCNVHLTYLALKNHEMF